MDISQKRKKKEREKKNTKKKKKVTDVGNYVEKLEHVCLSGG